MQRSDDHIVPFGAEKVFKMPFITVFKGPGSQPASESSLSSLKNFFMRIKIEEEELGEVAALQCGFVPKDH